MTIPTATKVKTKDHKIGVKGVKTKKVSKGDVKGGQMKPLKGTKQMAAKGKTAKNVVKVKTVKKK